MVEMTEPSLADLIHAVKGSEQLPAQRRTQWLCSLNKVSNAIQQHTGKSPDLLPVRWTALRQVVRQLHPATCHMKAKTFANHRANLRAAVSWFADATNLPVRGAQLTPAWASLREGVRDLRSRAQLSPAMRFWSARNIDPDSVNEAALDSYIEYRAATALRHVENSRRRAIARIWNTSAKTVQGWPKVMLHEPPCKTASVGPAWEMFPESLRRDIDTYLLALTKVRKDASGRRVRPCNDSTIGVRRASLKAYACKAVALGVPINCLATLRDLVAPELAARVIDAYWEESGEEPSSFTISLAGLLVDVAKQTNCVDGVEFARLQDMRFEVDQHHAKGMTSKNMDLIRQVLIPGVWRRVVDLPAHLMQEARRCSEQSPVKAAVLAQMAVAISILTVAPVRLGNLISIRLEQNLVRPAGPGGPFWLMFPKYDVKNRIRLEFPLHENMTKLIEEYLRDFLPTLRRGSNQLCMFPGELGMQKSPRTLSEQITKRIYSATGLRITVHQFRHAAAAIILQEHPGNYELVRRILGHKNIQTTIAFYVGLEAAQATRILGDIVHRKLEFEGEI